MNCPKCSYSNNDEAKFCNQCAAPLVQEQPIKTHPIEFVKVIPKEDWAYKAGKWWARLDANARFSVLGGGLVVVVFFVLFIGVSIDKFNQPSKNNKGSSAYYDSRSSSPSSGSNSMPSANSPQRPAISTPAYDLAAAKTFLNGRSTTSDIQNAKEHLNQIPAAAPEYKEAQELLAKIKAGKIRALTDFELENSQAIEALQDADHTITFEKVKKNPDRYFAQTWAFTGKILEIQERGSTTVARVGVGAYNLNAIWVEAPFTTEFLDNNNVFVVGTIKGTKSYTSQAGWEITIPHVQALAIVKPSDGAKLKTAAARQSR